MLTKRLNSLRARGFNLHADLFDAPVAGTREGITYPTSEPVARRPRWGEMSSPVPVPWSRTARERERRLSESIRLQFNMIDQGGKSLSCSCMGREGETSAHQSVRDADCSCMLTWQPRSRGSAEWQLRVQWLKMKVGSYWMLLLSVSFSDSPSFLFFL